MTKKNMSKLSAHPVHERLRIAILLAANAGFVDAYTFQYHGDRFASLQTGNIIQAGIALAKGEFAYSLNFILPIISFLLGAAFNGVLKHHFKHGKLSTQQHSLLVELVGINLVMLISHLISSTTYITILSFFLAVQLDAFPKVKGLPFTSVMSTANLRHVGASLTTYFYTKNKVALEHAGLFLLIILAFLFGSLFSTALVPMLEHFTLLGSNLFVLSIFFLIFDCSKKSVDK